MLYLNGYTREQWENYARKLEEFATGNTVGSEQESQYGTCRYCEHSEPELDLPAYSMFCVLEECTPIARELSDHYSEGKSGRTDFRVKAAAELAEFIRKEILK